MDPGRPASAGPVVARRSRAWLGLPSAAASGIEDAANAVRRGDPYGNWLLIFDNANEPEEVNDIIPHGPATSPAGKL